MSGIWRRLRGDTARVIGNPPVPRRPAFFAISKSRVVSANIANGRVANGTAFASGVTHTHPWVSTREGGGGNPHERADSGCGRGEDGRA